MEQDMNQEVEIDLIHLIRIILRKWILIGIITIATAIVAGGYAYIMLDDIYVAESSMIVQTKSLDVIELSNTSIPIAVPIKGGRRRKQKGGGSGSILNSNYKKNIPELYNLVVIKDKIAEFLWYMFTGYLVIYI